RTTPGKLPEAKELKPEKFTVSNEDWESFVTALDIRATARTSAARLYIRPEPEDKDKSELTPEWCPVQLQLRIGAINKEPAVDATIERFEHPLDVQFQPFTSKNIFPSSGRLHLYHPAADTTFGQFMADKTGKPSSVRLLCDAGQRTGVTLAWNARPSNAAV